MATLADLRSQGWHIDERKLEELLDGKEDVNLKNFLLDNDMREYGDSVVVTKVDRRAGVLEAGTYVFQMTRQRNVSVPKMNEGSHQSGLYKYTFTDGHNSVSALRFDPVPGLTEKTMPGTKVLLTGPITLEAGLLLIDAKNCRVIGGKVDKLIEKWQMDQHGISRTAAKSGAPKWIPFTKKKNVKANKGSDKAEKETNFKALDVIHKAHARDRSADAMAVDDEFSANRKALIDGLEKDHKKRRFAPNHTLGRSWSSSESLNRSKSRSSGRLNMNTNKPAPKVDNVNPRPCSSAMTDRSGARGAGPAGRGRAPNRGNNGGRGRTSSLQQVYLDQVVRNPSQNFPPRRPRGGFPSRVVTPSAGSSRGHDRARPKCAPHVQRAENPYKPENLHPGMIVKAPSSNGQFYDCEFVMHGPVADLCTVRYTELNKEAVLPIGYLRPA